MRFNYLYLCMDTDQQGGASSNALRLAGIIRARHLTKTQFLLTCDVFKKNKKNKKKTRRQSAVAAALSSVDPLIRATQ